MIEFFVVAIIVFSILSVSNLYYHFLLKKQKQKTTKITSVKNRKYDIRKEIVLTIVFILFLVVATLLMTYFFINIEASNFLIIYLGAITYFMLILAFSFIFPNKHKLAYPFMLATILIVLQLFFKNPLFGGLLMSVGYVGIVNYFLYQKIVGPKIIIAFLIIYMFYDFSTVFIRPIQSELVSKTTNNLFPAALIYKNTIMGMGDILFSLIMTTFARVYLGLSAALITSVLLVSPLIGLGVFVKLFPKHDIGLPYLILITPIFVVYLFFMWKKLVRSLSL